MKIRDQIEYRTVAGLLGLCRILPETLVYAVFKGLAALMYLLLIPRRKISILNTEIALPDKNPAERKRIVWRHFQHLAESIALNALITSGRITNEQLLDMVEADNWEVFEQLTKSNIKGLLVFSAHIGNWELMPQYAALRMHRQIHVISRKSNNTLLEDRIVRPLRERFGVNVFYKKNAMLNMNRAFRKKEPAGLLIDQRLNLHEGIPVEFFGKVTGTTATPAVMQIRFGVTTLPMFMIRSGKRKYRLIIGEPVHWKDNGKPFEEQVAELTSIHQKIVEDIIRTYPDQWFWVHDRWSLRKA